MNLRVYPAVRCFQTLPEIITSFLISSNNFEKLFKKWSGKRKIIYTYRARTALFHLLKYLKNNHRIKRVIVPSYICKEVIHPIKKAGLDIEFVDNNLKNLGVDDRNIKIHKYDSIIWVNYFGLNSTPSNKILKSGAIIIEDNASHFVKPSRYADFTLYSLGKGKEFSSSEGGIVTINKKKFENFEIKFENPGMSIEFYRFFEYLFWKLASLRIFYKISRKIKRRFFKVSTKESFDFSKEIDGLYWPMLSISKKLAYRQLVKLNKVKTKSKNLWEILLKSLNSKITILNPSDDSNFLFINFLVDERDKLKHFLENKNIFASVPWKYHIGKELKKKKFKNSEKIFLKLLQIKIDPTYMKEDDIKYISECINKFYER